MFRDVLGDDCDDCAHEGSAVEGHASGCREGSLLVLYRFEGDARGLEAVPYALQLLEEQGFSRAV